MKNLLLTTILLTFFSIFSFAQTEVSLTLNHKLGVEDFAFNHATTNNMGHDFVVTRLQYYISEIVLTHDGGIKTTVEDMWILVDASGPTSVALGNHPVTQLEGLAYKIGVDPDHNHLDPAGYATGHPLAPVFPSMHWGWASGYRFIAFEGYGGANLDQRIEIHGLGDDNYFEVSHRMNSTANNNQIDVNIDADYTRLVEDMILVNGVILHGFNRQGLQILENARDFTFVVSSGMSGVERSSYIESFDVFPNPTSNSTITIQFEAEVNGDYSINIRDVLGRTLVSNVSIDQNGAMKLQVPGKGLYFIELALEGKILMNRKVLSH